MTAPEDDNESKPGSGHNRISDEVVNEIKATILGIGYKRPPEHTRFKKGQSGNPKGRPKQDDDLGGDRSAHSLILRDAERKVRIRENGEEKELSIIEAVIRSQDASAIKGSAYSQKHVIERYDRAEQARRRSNEASVEFWRWYVEASREQIEQARLKGEPAPNLLPHPDDIVIDRERGVRFIGPFDEEEVVKFEATCKLRDQLLMQDALEQRLVDLSHPEGVTTAGLFFEIMERGLPPRMRLPRTEALMRSMRFESMSKRNLLKQVYRGWLALGRRAKRGWTFPPLPWGKAVVELIFEMAGDAISQEKRDGSETVEKLAGLLGEALSSHRKA